MTELRRIEHGLFALAVSGAVIVGLIAADASLHHADNLPLIAFAVGLVVARAVLSATRQSVGHRRLLRGLPAQRAVMLGYRVQVVPSATLGAFCAGLMRPAIYVTEGTLRSSTTAELLAVLAHEEHHRTRRDPLRLLLARTVADAFRPLPLFATLPDREAAVADLLADAAAVETVGETRPLAAALARFDESGAGVAPERVDRLVRTPPASTVSAVLPIATAIALTAIAAVLLLGHHTGVEHAGLLAALAPAGLAAARAGACLRAG